MGKDSTEKGGGGQLTVAEYSQRFFERTIEDVAASDGQIEKAGENFLNLIRKLQEAGHKDDVRVPLRVLRDEIGRIYFSSGTEGRMEKIETLFQMYDALESGAQVDLRAKESKQAAGASQMLDELRLRFSRLVIGDTWEAWPELKLLALKRVYNYAAKEKQSEKEAVNLSQPPTPTSRLGMRKLSRSLSGVSSGAVGSWQTTLDEFGKAPGLRLLPIIKLLLNESSGGIHVGLDTRRTSSSFRRRNSEDQAKYLSSQPSGFSDTGEASRRISQIEMDDLLGLTDVIEPAGPKPVDPFARNNADPASPATPQAEPASHSKKVPGSFKTGSAATRPPDKQSCTVVNGRFDVNVEPQPSQLPSIPRTSSNTSGKFTGTKLNLPRAESGTANDQPGSFNPFDLPSPTYSSPVPFHLDNSFANFSPVAAAPHAPPPAPMRQTPGQFGEQQGENAQRQHPK